MGKTKVLSNRIGPGTCSKEVDVAGQKVEILGPEESTLYLGRALNLRNGQDAEIDHRIKRAWAKFWTFKAELTNSHYSLSNRLRLFHAVVEPTALYGSGSWAMTRAREGKLRTAQRRMLRTILGKGRASLEKEDSDSESKSIASSNPNEALEGYVEWIQRVTAEVEAAMVSAGVPDWVEEQQRRKWRWCSHVCRRTDGRWKRCVLEWIPDGGHRCRARPVLRWADSIEKFVTNTFTGSSEDWIEQSNFEVYSQLAQNRTAWATLEDDFLEFCR